MFIVLGGVLVYALITFGAVLPQTWLFIVIFWLLSFAAILVLECLRGRSIKLPVLVISGLSAILILFSNYKFAAGVFAGGWAYIAAVRSPKVVTKFLHFILLVGILEALLGMTQYFVTPGWIFGYQSPFYETSGTLINRNHFAGLLEMFIPVAFGLAYSAEKRFGGLARPYLYLFAGAFMGLALFCSMSRMGIMSFLATVFFLAFLLQVKLSQRRVAIVMGFGMLGLVLAGTLWIGIDSIIQRYSELAGPDAILREGRFLVFKDTLRMLAANPSGVGIGNFQDRFREYQTFRPDLLFDHAHNDYLETASEWGGAVAAAFWSFLIFVVIRGVRLFLSIDSIEQRGILLACTGGIFSILIHSLADFNLQIPSNAILFFTLVGFSLAVPFTQSETGKYLN